MDSIVKIVKDFFGKGIGKGMSMTGGGGKCDKDAKENAEKEERKANRATLKNLKKLFQFGSSHDMMLMFIGTFFAVIHGTSFPVLAVLFGNISATFISESQGGFANSTTNDHAYHLSRSHSHHTNKSARVLREAMESAVPGTPANATSSENPLQMVADVFGFIGETLGLASGSKALTKEEFVEYADRYSIYFLCIAIVVLVSSFIQTVCWESAAENQIFRIRQQFVTQMLRQEISWFEKNPSGYVIAKLADDAERVREGIGHKFSIILEYSASFAIGAFFGLCINWKMTFIFGLSVPFIISKILYLLRLFSAQAIERQEENGYVGALAEDVFQDIYTVAAFGAELKERERYAQELKHSYNNAMKNYYVIGFGTGILYVIIFAAFAGASMYAMSQLSNHLISTKQVYLVFSSVSFAIVALVNILPFITDIAYSQGCLKAIMKVIESYPQIDPYCSDGRRPHKFAGKVKLNHVTFSYPTREDTSVLRDLNLTINAGSTVAILGESGEGKSTIVDLLLRFYDPQTGTVTFDDFDLKNLNLKWLRGVVGIVSTDSTFQADTIYNNITGGDKTITREDVLKATKIACAHDFIMEMENGYQTMIGINDRELTSGQKQLVAIARVLVNKPTILILDEALSAQSVKQADKVLKSLKKSPDVGTTLILSHSVTRVDTIETILVLKGGQIVEVGNHQTLMEKKGIYHQMAMTEGLSETATDHSGLPDDPVSDEVYEERSIMLEKAPDELGDGECSEEEKELQFPSFQEVTGQLGKEKNAYLYMGLGILGCVVSGLVQPLFGLGFSELFIAFSESGDKLTHDVTFWAIIIFANGVAAGIGYFLRSVYVSAIGEMMSCFLRNDVYFAILQQPFSWFDEEEHTPERLYNLLCRNTPIFKVSIGSRLGVVLSSIVSLMATIIIAFVLEWQLALVILAAIPVQWLIILGQKYDYQRYQVWSDKLTEDALSTATESAQDLRTVQTLSLQESIISDFEETAHKIYTVSQTQSLRVAVPIAVSDALVFVLFAAVFSTGAHLINIGSMAPINLFRLFIILTFSSFTLSRVSSFIPDYVVGKLAYAMLYNLFQEAQEDGSKDVEEFMADNLLNPTTELMGRITFDKVCHTYQDFPEDEILHEISFDLEPGSWLGIIGCDGKSTLMNLIVRFYDCDSGVLSIDGIDIKKIDLEHLRANIGYVTQDPSLFNRSISENILYGYQGNLEGPALQALLEETATTVSLHKFIESLPNGYDTQVGSHGSSLTAGERQRIAIARAIIRNPKILLLDDPTSALDAEQEMELIEALKKQFTGRTCIIISKQPKVISTVQYVAVFGSGGRIVEYGTHEELNALGGEYCEFMRAK